MISAELQQAIDSLQIQDVYLRGIYAQYEGDFDPKYFADLDSLVVQTKHHVKQSVVLASEETSEKVLQVFIDLGARWVDENNPDTEDSVKVVIEAQFVAEYAMKTMLEKSCIDEFSLKNASYHVWPYWRELLSSQCDRMHLPRVVLPTVQFAHNRHENALADEVNKQP